MSVSKKSLRGIQPPTKVDPPTRKPATGQSLLQSVSVQKGGPGQSWFNLTRKDVEEKLSKYRQQQAATKQGSLWQRLANAFGKSRKSD